MHGAHEFLAALTTVLGVAAVTTVLFQWLRQPVVLGYLIAGLIIGPHVPIPLVADPETVETLSELGVILLMFSVGLELRLTKLLQLGATAGVTAVVQCSLMVWLGFMTGRLFGWTGIESVFLGAIIAISSTTIIAKAFDEQGVKGKLREIVVGILVIEDLIAILLMAALTAVASGNRLSAGHLAITIARLVGFLIVLLVVGLLTVPRAVRAVARLGRPETLLITSVAICFGVALLARSFGYSVALGAFIAGSLVAESGQDEVTKRIEHLVQPVRDLFATVFFVSVGMMIDPALIVRAWAPIAVLTVVVVAGKVTSVTFGAFLTGSSVRTSVQAGMSLAQIGEFSFIIAGLGLSLGATRELIYPVAVSVSALTTLLTPWLIRAAGPAADWIDRKLPRSLQTFVALYGSWIERLRRPGDGAVTQAARARRLARLLLLDAALLAGILIGASLAFPSIVQWIVRLMGAKAEAHQTIVRPIIVAVVALLSAPFCIGIVRVARQLGVTLAEIAFPTQPAPGELDLAAAPRRALVVTLQLACVLLVGAPVLAITQPFFQGLEGAALLILLLAMLSIGLLRSATNLAGHVRAGSQMIVEALAAQVRPGPADAAHAAHAASAAAPDLDHLLPGLGAPLPIELAADSPAVGRSLGAVNLRARSGATVLVILRGGQGIVPSADEALRAGDVLALAGSHDALAAARAILLGNGA
jgi:CPA2 family monovalent cation:H+ antiporter-2